MPRSSNPITIALLLVLLIIVPSSNRALCQDNRGKFLDLIQTAWDILAGKNTQQAKSSIAHGSRLICGSKYEDLLSVVSRQTDGCSLVDTSYHGVMVSGQTNPSEDMGYFVLKTRTSDTTKVRFHTVVFMKDSTGQYKIFSWQAGE